MPVAGLAGEGEDRVRAGPDLAVDAAGQVLSQEREARVRDRVDERRGPGARASGRSVSNRRGTGRSAARARRPVIAATRSDCEPGAADQRRLRPARRPAGPSINTSHCPARRSALDRGRRAQVVRSLSPPRARTSSAYAALPRAEVDDPVSGEWSPATPLDVRLDLRHALRARRAPGRARRSPPPAGDLLSPGSSLSEAATTSLPQRSNGMPCPSQKASSSRLAFAAQHRLPATRPGSRARRGSRRCCGPDWWLASSASFSRTTTAQVGPALEQPVRGREADNSATDDRDVEPSGLCASSSTAGHRKQRRRGSRHVGRRRVRDALVATPSR